MPRRAGQYLERIRYERPQCFVKLMADGEFYEPACTVLERVPQDAREESELRRLHACSECEEGFWRAVKAAADARAARRNGKVEPDA
jgi:hypothetical protein